MEMLEYSKVMVEDLQIGVGTKEIRLQGQRVAQMSEIHPGVLLPIFTYNQRPTAGQGSMTFTGAIPAKYRVWGVTVWIREALGTTNSLTGFMVGDGTIADRWGTVTTLTIDTETDQGDFRPDPYPIYTTATDVVLAAVGGLFDGTGLVQIQVHAHPLVHRRL